MGLKWGSPRNIVFIAVSDPYSKYQIDVSSYIIFFTFNNPNLQHSGITEKKISKYKDFTIELPNIEQIFKKMEFLFPTNFMHFKAGNNLGTQAVRKLTHLLKQNLNC